MSRIAPTSLGCVDFAAAAQTANAALSPAGTSCRFAVTRFPIVFRIAVNGPLLGIVLQMCVNPES